MKPESAAITVLLRNYREGDRAALEELIPLVYSQLKGIARNCLNRAGGGNTLVTTALVNEAFIRLVESENVTFNDRTHFFAVAAQCMRFLLADYVKARTRQKRGGSGIRVSFDERFHSKQAEEMDLEAVNTALNKLTQQDPRLARIVELRFLAGLSVEETAEALAISPATVKRDWQLAKAWLTRELGAEKAA